MTDFGGCVKQTSVCGVQGVGFESLGLWGAVLLEVDMVVSIKK